MTKREKRVVKSFINCVKEGEFSFDYAVTLIENSEKFGYLSPEAKEIFYAEFEKSEVTDYYED